MNIMKKSITLILFLLSLTVTAQKENFESSQIFPIERSHSFIGFSVKYMGFAKVRGRFESFNGSFRYDQNNIKKTSISLSINVKSIDTDLNFRDRDLRSKNWFDAETFPTIRFVSTKVKKDVNGLLVTGDLTVKKTTKKITFKLEHSGILKDNRGDNQVILSGSFSINRKDYDVRGDNWSRVREGITAVSDNVQIEFTALGKQILEENYSNWVRRKTTPHGLIYSIYKEEGLKKALQKFDELASDSERKINPNALNVVGYMLLKSGKLKDAITIFKRNIQQFPENANVYDSYAEALATNKQWKEAKKNFLIALEKDPDNMNAAEYLRHIK